MAADARFWTGPRLAGGLVAGALAGASLIAGAARSAPDPTPGPVPGVAHAAHVEEIFPTAARLPSNLLRFYIVFSAPMSSGEAHTRLRLVDDRGQAVPGAFLELEEELWDPSGRRLTVLLDPGRIKRGLRANLESGAPLVEGRRYRLEVDASWRDAHGRPLVRGYAKAFEAVAADRTSPDVEAWVLAPPASDTRQPLVARFPEPLDRALLASALTIVDAAGHVVDGQVGVASGEREWSFTPRDPWSGGRHELRIAAELEDVAGNNLRRVFDVDLSRAAPPPDGPPTRVRAFTIGPRSAS
jgi:hypothetical protein